MTAPTIAGARSGFLTTDEQSVTPFGDVMISDTSSSPSDSASITVTDSGAPTDADGSLSGSGLTQTGVGTYTVAATDPGTLAAELAALVFTPASQLNPADTSATTDFALDVTNASGTGVASTQVVTTYTANPTDTITINAAGQAYLGDPAFIVYVNGAEVGGPFYVNTQYVVGGSFEQFTLTGDFGITAGSTVRVDYINDLYGGSSTADRNLVVGSVTVDGNTYQGSTAAQIENVDGPVDSALSNAGFLYNDGSLTFDVTPSSTVTGGLSLVGVNLSGQEQVLDHPDYGYPTLAELEYYASKGLNLIRLPFAWEAIQPQLGGSLNSTELGKIETVVEEANALGMKVDLDLHNFGEYDGNYILNTQAGQDDFVNFWTQMAGVFKDNPNVLFGLMNEPNLIDPSGITAGYFTVLAQYTPTWIALQNETIAAIRATGATSQTILVSALAYDSALEWNLDGSQGYFTSGSGTGTTIVDSSNNVVFDVHQYFDANGSGTGTATVTTGPDDLAAITAWANQTGQKLLLGETGVNGDTAGISNLNSTLAYMAANSNVWVGIAYWEGGLNYTQFFSIDPTNGVDSTKLQILDQYAPAIPTISGLLPTYQLPNGATTIDPLSGIVIIDKSPTASDSATVVVSDPGSATDANGVFTGGNFTQTGPGTYTVAATDPATLASELANLVFTPTSAASNSSTDFTLTITGTAGTATTDTIFTACYCPGTMIDTDDGPIPIERLRIGDRVRTASGLLRPVRWIGRRSYSVRFARRNQDLWPVTIHAGALADGVPRRDLSVSPRHAMFIDAMLVPAEALINGVSVTQSQPLGQVDYLHIELDDHDVIWAEGAASETFVDDDSREMFQNAQEYCALYPRATRHPAKYCAPRVTEGVAVCAIREHLAIRAGLHAPPQMRPLRGYIDYVSDELVEGWAQDPSRPDSPVCLDVLVGGTVVAQALANRGREDLARAGIGSGRHGFSIELPLVLQIEQRRTLEVRRSADGAILERSAAALLAA